MSSHKGSWNRVKDRKAWDECPLWDKKKTQNGLIAKDEHIETEGQSSEPDKIIDAKCISNTSNSPDDI